MAIIKLDKIDFLKELQESDNELIASLSKQLKKNGVKTSIYIDYDFSFGFTDYKIYGKIQPYVEIDFSDHDRMIEKRQKTESVPLNQLSNQEIAESYTFNELVDLCVKLQSELEELQSERQELLDAWSQMNLKCDEVRRILEDK